MYPKAEMILSNSVSTPLQSSLKWVVPHLMDNQDINLVYVRHDEQTE